MSIKDYQDRVREIGCVLCKHLGTEGEPPMIHHVEVIRNNPWAEYAVVPLCYFHHQGPNGVHGLGRRGFVSRYKLTDIDLLAMVARALDK